MISSAEKTMTVLGISFRLLNSEIGNDLLGYCKFNFVDVTCFRLLNSEIGNDQKSMEMIKKAFRGFRLLNSEIGNDLAILSDCRVIDFSFRLLNSEIGNDHLD